MAEKNYKKRISLGNPPLQEVKVEEPEKKRRESTPIDSYERRMRKKSRNEFGYVNNAYVGSLNSVHEVSLPQPPTSVIREQYWTCSKWPFAQRILAIAVGVLLGAVIGLAVTMIIRKAAPDLDIGGIIRSTRTSAPD